MSLSRRNALIRSIRALAQQVEFHSASGDLEGRLEASAVALEIDAAYLRWGLDEIDGLSIDGEKATVETLISKGPEALAREMVTVIRGECALSDEERKN